jgi:hypothetical protein
MSWTNLKLADQRVDRFENPGALFCDLRADHPTVGPLATPSDEAQ